MIDLDELERLRNAVLAIDQREHRDEWYTAHVTFNLAVFSALPALLALARDGERCKWLLEMWPLEITRLVHSHHTTGPTSSDVRAAIDAARKGEKP